MGGTITMAAYGYWINAKGWRDSTWMRVMRWDNRVAYATTGVFVLAMVVVGAELVHAVGADITSGDAGLLDLDELLRERYGGVLSAVFLVGFFATSFSSLLGVWNGVSLMVSDFWANLRAPPARRPAPAWPTAPPSAARRSGCSCCG